MWTVEFADEFDPDYDALDAAVQDELIAQLRIVEQFGPMAKRPRVDTLNGSKHANMKELRFDWEKEVWRVAFAFDPKRRAVLLVGGDKARVDQKRFYRRLIAVADERFERHLESLRAKKNGRIGKETGHGKKS